MGGQVHDDQITGLGFLLGTFTGTDVVQPSSWSEGATVAAAATGSVRDAGVLVLEQTSGTAEGPFHLLTVVMPVGPGDGGQHDGAGLLAYAFDTAGFRPEPAATGVVSDDGALRFTRRTERGESRTTYRPTADGFAWVKEFRPAPTAAWSAVVEGSLRRVR
ncbi:MAG: hypothetical protein ACTHQ3_06180 [Motilibacteraceae bacterium]